MAIGLTRERQRAATAPHDAWDQRLRGGGDLPSDHTEQNRAEQKRGANLRQFLEAHASQHGQADQLRGAVVEVLVLVGAVQRVAQQNLCVPGEGELTEGTPSR